MLKFGGSVLTDESTLRRAVHEIHRWRRDDYRVVAVVSALAGTTDALLGECQSLAGESADHAVAAVVAGGELHCASLLGLLLDRAGIPARVLSPSAVNLVAEGAALDADPVAVDAGAVLSATSRDHVVVVPGYVARDARGRTVVLGRGGSDLTALFLAARLHARRCRLVKDVDGLYAWDPALDGPRPARYESATWQDALRTDGSIVQHKAVRCAERHGQSFELGALNTEHPTTVGEGPTRHGPSRAPRRPLRVALLGLGTVGGGVFELLRGLPELFQVTSVCVRDPKRPRTVDVDVGRLTTDPLEAVRGADVVVEAWGGTNPARQWVGHALAQGRHVVTANKALVASAGEDLAQLARQNACAFRYSAAVGGCLPLLERASVASSAVTLVRGVLNGTANFVLDGLEAGRSLEALLAEARELGFAERRGDRDLSGEDAADKLCVLASALGHRLAPESVERDVIDAAVEGRIRRSTSGTVLRQVSTLRIGSGSPDGEHLRTPRVQATVRLEELDAGDPLAAVRAEQNAAVLEHESGDRSFVAGRGAGRWPTAESVVGDLLDLARRRGARQESASVQRVR